MDLLLTANAHLTKEVEVPSLLVASDDNVTRLTSQEHGGYRTNIQNPFNISMEHLAEAATVLVPGGSSFTLVLGVKGGFHSSGRNMQFVGASNVACPPRAVCSSYTCPSG